jgi:hypothetical protein
MIDPMVSFPEKPKQIRYAVMFLWVTFAQMAISIVGFAPQFDLDEDICDDAPLLTVLLIILSILIPKLSHGCNWARTGIITFAIVGIAIDIYSISGILRAGPFFATLDLIGDIALVAAACLISSKPGSNWFMKR